MAGLANARIDWGRPQYNEQRQATGAIEKITDILKLVNAPLTVTETVTGAQTTVTQTRSVTLHEAAPPAVTSTVTVRETIEGKAPTRTTWQTVTATNYAYKTGSGLILSTSPLRYDDLVSSYTQLSQLSHANISQLTNYTTAYMIKVAEEVEDMIKTLTFESSWRHDIRTFLPRIESAIKLLQQCAQIRKQVGAHVKIHHDDIHALRPGYTVFGAATRLLQVVENGLVPYADWVNKVDPHHPSIKPWNTLQQLKAENQELWNAFETFGRLDNELFAALTKKQKHQSPTNLDYFLRILMLAGISYMGFRLHTGFLSISFFILLIAMSEYPADMTNSFMARPWNMKVMNKLEKREQNAESEGQDAVSTDAEAEVKETKKDADMEEGEDWIVVDKTGSEADDVKFTK